METLLYIIILGLVLNLIANLIWKYIPSTKHMDIWATGILISVCVLLVAFNRDKKEINSQITTVRLVSDANTYPKDQTATIAQKNVNPHKLVEIIKKTQLAEIKESYGELANQCFTNQDLMGFKDGNRCSLILGRLRQNNEFIDVVLAIKRMDPTERQQLLDMCSKFSRPTWTELGRISREGQTDAGHEAELIISREIVNLVKEFCKLPEEKIKELYQ